MTLSRTRWLAVALATGLAAFGAPAAAQTIGYNVRTGDVWVDTRLGEINQYGSRYRDPFVDELNRHYGAPRPLLVELLERRRWAPADVYYACAIAHALGRPCIEVVREYDRNPRGGWGEVAKRMGIKPGSAAFHALKRGTVATYDRWGHPVSLDRNARVDWSDGHGGKRHDERSRHSGKGDRHGPAKGDHAGGHGGHGKPAHAGGKGHADKGREDKGGGKGNGNGKGKGGKD